MQKRQRSKRGLSSFSAVKAESCAAGCLPQIAGDGVGEDASPAAGRISGGAPNERFFRHINDFSYPRQSPSSAVCGSEWLTGRVVPANGRRLRPNLRPYSGDDVLKPSWPSSILRPVTSSTSPLGTH